MIKYILKSHPRSCVFLIGMSLLGIATGTFSGFLTAFGIGLILAALASANDKN